MKARVGFGEFMSPKSGRCLLPTIFRSNRCTAHLTSVFTCFPFNLEQVSKKASPEFLNEKQNDKDTNIFQNTDAHCHSQ